MGERRDALGLEVAEERLALRELIRRRVLEEVVDGQDAGRVRARHRGVRAQRLPGAGRGPADRGAGPAARDRQRHGGHLPEARSAGGWLMGTRYPERVEKTVRQLAAGGRGLPQDLVSADRLTRIEELHGVLLPRPPRADHPGRGRAGRGRGLPGASSPCCAVPGLDSYEAEPELSRVLDRVEDPVLNPGEAWADRALADAGPVRGRRATAAEASAEGHLRQADRHLGEAARALVDEIGTRPCGSPCWAGSTSGAGTDDQLHIDPAGSIYNSMDDPFNADALRGVAWLPPCCRPRRTPPASSGRSSELPEQGRPARPAQPEGRQRGRDRARPHGRRSGPRRAGAAVHPRHLQGHPKQLERRLDARAQALGLSREEVEELGIPAYGLSGVGHGEPEWATSPPCWRCGAQARCCPGAMRRARPSSACPRR